MRCQRSGWRWRYKCPLRSCLSWCWHRLGRSHCSRGRWWRRRLGCSLARCDRLRLLVGARLKPAQQIATSAVRMRLPLLVIPLCMLMRGFEAADCWRDGRLLLLLLLHVRRGSCLCRAGGMLPALYTFALRRMIASRLSMVRCPTRLPILRCCLDWLLARRGRGRRTWRVTRTDFQSNGWLALVR